MKKIKKPFIEYNKWNQLKGKELIELGFRTTDQGFLISNTALYKVFPIAAGKWQIRLA